MPYPRAPAKRYPGGCELTGYDQFLIDRLKSLPLHARRYDPDRRAWWVSAPYDEQAIRWFRDAFPYASVFEASGARQAPPSRRPLAAAQHFQTLYLAPDAPLHVAEAVFRHLAKRNHPDLVPAGEQHRATATMAALNAAIEAVRCVATEDER